jgi:hypothetical protein
METTTSVRRTNIVFVKLVKKVLTRLPKPDTTYEGSQWSGPGARGGGVVAAAGKA